MLHGSSQFQLQVLDNVRAILIGIGLHSHAIPLLLDGICPGGSNPLGVGLKQHTGLHSRLRIPRDGDRVRAHTVRDLIAPKCIRSCALAALLSLSVPQTKPLRKSWASKPSPASLPQEPDEAFRDDRRRVSTPCLTPVGSQGVAFAAGATMRGGFGLRQPAQVQSAHHRKKGSGFMP